ncbi:MAG: hypothetical protein ACRETQ_04280 [Gammaproteobacteria bacterium]
MSIPADKTKAGISTVTLQLAATVLGLIGTALVIVQAGVWVAHSGASIAALIATACVPLIAAGAFAVVPRRADESTALHYPLSALFVWITLLLPVALTALALILVGVSGSFAHYFGLALLVAANAGRNLRDLVRAIRLHALSTRA